MVNVLVKNYIETVCVAVVWQSPRKQIVLVQALYGEHTRNHELRTICFCWRWKACWLLHSSTNLNSLGRRYWLWRDLARVSNVIGVSPRVPRGNNFSQMLTPAALSRERWAPSVGAAPSSHSHCLCAAALRSWDSELREASPRTLAERKKEKKKLHLNHKSAWQHPLLIWRQTRAHC